MPRMADLAREDIYYDPMTGVPIGAAVGEPKVTDYGQADLTPFAMGALAQQRDYQPTDARGTDLWGYQMGGHVVPPSEIDKAINMVMATSGGGLATKGIKAYHSSPHDFDKFDLKKIGTGEGAQVYGHGLYFAENPAVSGQGGQYWNQFMRRFEGTPEGHAAAKLRDAKFDREAALNDSKWNLDQIKDYVTHGKPEKYDDVQRWHYFNDKLLPLRQAEYDALASGKPVGPRTYEVNIKADPAQMLDWDKPLREQAHLHDVARQIDLSHMKEGNRSRVLVEKWRQGTEQPEYPVTGQQFHAAASGHGNFGPRASDQLREAGIPGIKYLDERSRAIQPAITDIERAIKQGDMYKGASPDMWASRLDELKATPLTNNYVVFDPSIIDIMKKYGIAGAAPAGMGALAAQDYYSNQ